MGSSGNAYDTQYAENRIDQLFSTNGDGTGTHDMAAGSASYSVVVPTGSSYGIRRVLFTMTDAGIRLNRFGGIATLANGILITVNDADDSVLHTFTPHAIVRLSDFGLLAGPDVPTVADVGDDTFICRWTLEKAGRDIFLAPGQYMKIQVRDTLTDLTEFHAQAQGWKWKK